MTNTKRNDFVVDRLPEMVELSGDIFGFLAMVFNTRPDHQFVEQLHSLDLRALQQISNQDGLTDEMNTGVNEIIEFIDQLIFMSDTEALTALAKDWTKLFRGVRPEYGPKPPYEAVYLGKNAEDFTILQQLFGIYRDNGYQINENHPERPDYIGVEMEFVALMIKQENHYVSEMFLKDHLEKWVGQFCDLAIPIAGTGFYRGLLRLTKSMIED